MPAVQARYQLTLDLTTAESPHVRALPAREGPYIIKVVSGDLNIAATTSSAQDVLDDVAVWEDWPHGAVSGPYPADVLEDAEALRFTVTADAVVHILGVRS